MFTKGGLQVSHLLEIVDESWSHFTLYWVSTKKIGHHFILADQSVSKRQKGKETLQYLDLQGAMFSNFYFHNMMISV